MRAEVKKRKEEEKIEIPFPVEERLSFELFVQDVVSTSTNIL